MDQLIRRYTLTHHTHTDAHLHFSQRSDSRLWTQSLGQTDLRPCDSVLHLRSQSRGSCPFLTFPYGQSWSPFGPLTYSPFHYLQMTNTHHLSGEGFSSDLFNRFISTSDTVKTDSSHNLIVFHRLPNWHDTHTLIIITVTQSCHHRERSSVVCTYSTSHVPHAAAATATTITSTWKSIQMKAVKTTNQTTNTARCPDTAGYSLIPLKESPNPLFTGMSLWPNSRSIPPIPDRYMSTTRRRSFRLRIDPSVNFHTVKYLYIKYINMYR